MAEEEARPDVLRELLEALGDVRVNFWTCPIREHSERTDVPTVEWWDGTAWCTVETCGRTSANVRTAWCENYREDLDKPCDGTLRFGPGDIEAACSTCGGRCGFMVANYIEGQT